MMDEDPDQDEYYFPSQNSVRFNARRTEFRSDANQVDGMLTNCTELLDTLHFNPWSFTPQRSPDPDGRDMQLILQMFTTPFALFGRFNIRKKRLLKWVEGIAGQYQANAYHNWTHALDVCHLVHYMLTAGTAGKYFNFQDILVLLTAAIAHDVAHPGVTTPFLITTGHELALVYNDQSPMENMHSYRFFNTMKRSGHDFMEGAKGFKVFRSKVIAAILATDMAQHFNFVDKFASRAQKLKGGDMVKNTVEEKARKATSQQDRQLLLEAFLHTADVGGNFKEIQYQMISVKMLEEEWFAQGDKERSLGLPISPNSDRHKDSAARVQKFFLGHMLQPLLTPLCIFVSDEVSQALQQNLRGNIEVWDESCKQFPSMSASRMVPLLVGQHQLPVIDYQFSSAENSAQLIDIPEGGDPPDASSKTIVAHATGKSQSPSQSQSWAIPTVKADSPEAATQRLRAAEDGTSPRREDLTVHQVHVHLPPTE